MIAIPLAIFIVLGIALIKPVAPVGFLDRFEWREVDSGDRGAEYSITGRFYDVVDAARVELAALGCSPVTMTGSEAMFSCAATPASLVTLRLVASSVTPKRNEVRMRLDGIRHAPSVWSRVLRLFGLK